MKIPTLVLAGLLSASLIAYADKKVIVSGATTEHADIGIAYEDGEWDLHVHDDGNGIEYEPSQVILLVGSVGKTTVPDNPAFSFLGAPGSPIWVLPQVQTEGLLFLGFGAEEIPDGTFLNNQFELALKKVSGPGEFIIWDLDAFGNPIVVMNSRDGLSSTDVLHGVTGSHAHLNMGFTKAGHYRITFEATATLPDGTVVSSGNVTYLFRVEREASRH